MYQALYRKWRPRTFDDVVGQEHITETLKRQVTSGRLSHAYLFTGTRGTGKTTCAKILARAVNCLNPVNGNPCNQCAACQSIESGGAMEVLELDAASNNGVDQVRALRDEAVYPPAAVRKRVYIVDEVHMLSTPAFNALLKILEEPPPYLMFILATTEIHKVPATIKSRCQQFSFKRILPGQIAQRLSYVAQQEGIGLTQDGAALLARLADGGMRDALSLLDQCAGGGQQVDEKEILDTLGLAGNLETARLMERIAVRDTAGALEALGRLYGNGKEVGSVLEELSALARDLLLRKTAPKGGAALLNGGYDEGTLTALGEKLDAPRLLQMLRLLQATLPELARSTSRRTDAELCLIRLCDERLDGSAAGLAARVARLEEQLAQGVPAASSMAPPVSAPASPKKAEPPAPPAWAEEQPPLPPEPEEEPSYEPPDSGAPPAPEPPEVPVEQSAASAPEKEGTGDTAFWPAFAAGVADKVSPSVRPYLHNPAKVSGVWRNGVLTLWVDGEFTRAMLSKPALVQTLTQEAASFFQTPQVRVSVVVGRPPAEPPASSAAAPDGERDALEDLLAFGEKYDNIKIQ